MQKLLESQLTQRQQQMGDKLFEAIISEGHLQFFSLLLPKEEEK